MAWDCSAGHTNEDDNAERCHYCGLRNPRAAGRLQEEQQRVEKMAQEAEQDIFTMGRAAEASPESTQFRGPEKPGRGSWGCPSCGSLNARGTSTCTNCGASKPRQGPSRFARFRKRAAARFPRTAGFLSRTYGGGEGGRRNVTVALEVIVGLLIALFLQFLTGAALGDWSWVLFTGIIFFSLSMIFSPTGPYGVLRAVFRFCGFFFTGLAFVPFNSFVVLLIFFAGYFSMPLHVRSQEPGDAALAVFRFIFGVAISLYILIVFSGGFPAFNVTALSISVFLISLGLLAALPTNEGQNQNRFVIILSRGAERQGGLATGIIIVGFVLGFFGLINEGAGLATFLIFIVLGLTSIAIAWSVAPMERGMIGAPLLIIFLFLFIVGSESIQEATGQAAFGVYWPQVQEGLMPVSELFKSVGGSGTTLRVGFACIVDPIGCQQRFQPQTKTQGTVRAVEITQLSVVGESTVTRIYQNTSVLLEVRNDGNEVAKDITVTFDRPTIGGAFDAPVVGSVEVSCPKGQSIQIGAGATAGRSCRIDRLFPGEPSQMLAVYRLKLDNIPKKIEPRGNFINYKTNVAYKYNVSSSLDVTLMRGDFYDELARNARLKITEVPTTDTGGPVRMGIAIYNNRMPIRAGLDNAPVLMQLQNQGSGKVTNVFAARINVSGIIDTNRPLPPPTPDACSTENGQLRFTVSKSQPIESPESGTDPEKTRERSTCIIALKNIDLETQSSGIIGEAQYEYVITRTARSLIEFGTGKLCKCENNATVTVYGDQEACTEDCETFCADKGGKQSCA